MKLALALSTIALTAAVTIASPARAEDAQKCGLKLYTSIDLTVTDGGGVLVPVSLNGQPAAMALALGSAATVISSASADKLSLRRVQAPPADIFFGQERVKQVAKFDSFAVGGLGMGKGSFLIVSGLAAGTTPDGREIIGLLGAEVLSVVDFELDLAHKKLNLFSQDHCRGNVVYWAKAYDSAPLYRGELNELYFPMELEGKKVQAVLSPSDPVTTLRTDVTKKLYGFDKSSPGIEEKHSDDGTRFHYRAMQLTAPGLTVRNVRIKLGDPAKGCQLEKSNDGSMGYDYHCMGAHPMALGRNVLQTLQLYFATKEKMLYFTSADAGAPPGPALAPADSPAR